MTIGEHLSEFGGYNVQQWNPGDPLPDPQTTICRISCEWEEEPAWPQKFAAFLALPDVEQTRGLVVGLWDTEPGDDEEPTDVVEALVAAQGRLPRLEALFFGDITFEENEISWIPNTDLAPVLAAYPNLKHFGVRGGNGLSLGGLHSDKLETLIIQAGGLSAEVVREVMAAKLPNLRHLEVYLGTEDYGATSSVGDLAPILDGQLFPRLRYLGLKDSDYQDAIAQALAGAAVLEGLDTLDLSMGILTDEGGQALLGSGGIKKLQKLDLHHHFMSDEMMEKLAALSQNGGPEVDLSEQEETEEDDWRYVALGE